MNPLCLWGHFCDSLLTWLFGSAWWEICCCHLSTLVGWPGSQESDGDGTFRADETKIWALIGQVLLVLLKLPSNPTEIGTISHLFQARTLRLKVTTRLNLGHLVSNEAARVWIEFRQCTEVQDTFRIIRHSLARHHVEPCCSSKKYNPQTSSKALPASLLIVQILNLPSLLK